MKALALLLAVSATACAASQPAATTPASAKHSQPASDVGATNLQATDDPNRALKSGECEELGGWITQVCHDNNSRQARIEGWCSDMVARAATESWASACGKLKYMDFVCFRSVDTPQSMMTCDRTVDK